MEVHCGESPNVVPDTAEYSNGQVDQLSAVFDQMDVPYTVEDNRIIVHGKSVHASQAQDGKNAIALLAKGLVGFQPHPAVSFIGEKIGVETNGFTLFGEIRDDISGELTLNVGKLEINDNYSEVVLDIRIPVTHDKQRIETALKEAVELYGLEYKEFDYLPSLNVPVESDLVQTLLDLYKDKTGDDSEPMITGGATYARAMPNMVAFGAHFPGQESLAHQENEHITLDEFYTAMDIYSEAIFRLACAN